jgi:hypothetical protein
MIDLAPTVVRFTAARLQASRPNGPNAWETRFRGLIYFCELDTTTRGVIPHAEFNGEFGADQRDGPMILPWRVNGDDVWLTLDERVKYLTRSACRISGSAPRAVTRPGTRSRTGCRG